MRSLYGCIFVFCLLFGLQKPLQAQIEIRPLKSNPVLLQHAQKQYEELQRSEDTLALPFMDDFSYPGPFPDPALWLDKDVFINNTMAYQPPSVGVATFDGIDESGQPYGSGEGLSDILTSNYIDLGNAGPGTFLSFYIAPKGLTFPPSLNDSLALEFKDTSGQWLLVDAYNGLNNVPINEGVPFQFYNYEIDDEAFLYKGFQFRFVRYGDLEGIDNTFHLDYVRLANTDIPDGTFQDIAFTQVPTYLLDAYTAMPWKHFEGNEATELAKELEVSLFNHFAFTETAEPSSLLVKELSTATNIISTATLLEVPPLAPVNQRDLASQQHASFSNPLDLSAMAGAFPGQDSLIFQMMYDIDVTEENPATAPMVERNNTVTQNTVFANYFARDDGTAEGVVLVPIGYMVAMRYRANVADTLRAVQFNFPHFLPTPSENVLFNIKVYVGSLDNGPAYERNFVRLYYANSTFDTLQGFTTYPLVDLNGAPSPIALPPGDFYVAWQQVSAYPGNAVHMGLDVNSRKGEGEHFLWNQTEWTLIDTNNFQGTLMMRAVVGNETPRSTQSLSAEEANLSAFGIELFPNPAQDVLYCQLAKGQYDEFQIAISDTAGRLFMKAPLSDQVALQNLSPGLYFAIITHLQSQDQQTHKLLIIN